VAECDSFTGVNFWACQCILYSICIISGNEADLPSVLLWDIPIGHSQCFTFVLFLYGQDA